MLTFINNGCNWENGEENIKKNNLICKGLSALELGYHCSEKHISFLNNWFRNDSISLKKIIQCPKSFPIRTISTSIKSLTLERKKDKIIITASIIGTNTRLQKTSEWKDI